MGKGGFFLLLSALFFPYLILYTVYVNLDSLGYRFLFNLKLVHTPNFILLFLCKCNESQIYSILLFLNYPNKIAAGMPVLTMHFCCMEMAALTFVLLEKKV